MKTTRPLPITHRVLHIPVKNGQPKVKISLALGEQPVREFEVELAPLEAVDWWAFTEMSEFTGQTLTLTASEAGTRADLPARLAALRQGDDIPAAGDLYQELYRPQFHFTPRRGWSNDPNGMVFLDGEWHLFFQHNPFGIQWGNMHWGHAVSRDLVHWQELPTALYQRSLDDMAFSGGAVVDFNNTAGFQRGERPPLVLAFTSTGRGECLAYSLDGGRTFQEYSGNPVLRHAGRDPKIIWLTAAQKWVMIIYDDPNGDDTGSRRGYTLLDSPDLKQWRETDFMPGYFECPELFELPIQGEPGATRWVIHGALWQSHRSVYQVGTFDGEKFVPETPPLPAHYGPHFYAAQLFSHAPSTAASPLGRRILIGWLAGADYPGMAFGHGMTVPLEISLRRTPSGLRLCFQPVEELDRLIAVSRQAPTPLSLSQANAWLAGLPGELFDIRLQLEADGDGAIAFNLGGHPILWQPAYGQISFAGMTAPLQPGRNGSAGLELRVLIDRSVTEVFADQGYAAFASMTVFPAGERQMRLEGPGLVSALTVHTLKSIW